MSVETFMGPSILSLSLPAGREEKALSTYLEEGRAADEGAGSQNTTWKATIEEVVCGRDCYVNTK